ncbi:aminoglycoside phosphotransferase family protein [Aestuariicoccus sp. MJ-SS9]|uniref:aminoglycoside phosphotransferase family protein n=1 Tax=Aestuariicoccus sp. MJ-SS9 TaxID=3079855 RepID=UPI00290A60A1|nr:phosphotransferase [Aestuariicoccus sp. MJ-SS9]MDU8910855.1 phosphotransferase [Aestuariicoccus sp. MJ-SS9]
MNDFLQSIGWAKARRAPLAGDASSRRYWRLSQEGQSAILMADPDGDIPRFAHLARHLRDLGLSAPDILAEAPGYLLLEDLGDELFAALCDTDPTLERSLYIAATDVLIALHRHPAPEGLSVADPPQLARMTDLAFDWYLTGATGQADDRAKHAAISIFDTVLAQHTPIADVMILRDYHAENLIWLPNRPAPANVGLLDFQDAMRGHRAYDLVSLLRDARRDVTDDTASAVVAHYLRATGADEMAFGAAFAALGVQRNLRILGVFARLSRQSGKPRYIDLIPRVWGHLQRDLAHPALSPLQDILAVLPAPTADILNRLRAA